MGGTLCGVRTKHGPGVHGPLFGPDPWTTFMDRVHGPHVKDQVHGQFFFYSYKKVLHQVHGKQK